MLFNHCLNKRPKSIMGSKVIKINIKGTISWNNKALIVYVIANNNLALGSRLCKKVSFFKNLNALRNSKEILKPLGYSCCFIFQIIVKKIYHFLLLYNFFRDVNSNFLKFYSKLINLWHN